MSSNEFVINMSNNERWKYSSLYHGTIHSFFAVLAAIFGFIYADGQYGTTWFHCNYYKLNMFDSQKYLLMISMGYMLQNFVMCLRTSTSLDTPTLQLFLHHLLCISGTLLALYLGGFFGSCSQVTFIVEASTVFVNLRQILAMHRLDDGLLYKLNSLVMTVAFFVFRVCFFYYMVFWKC